MTNLWQLVVHSHYRPPLVIPAKAGIRCVGGPFPMARGVDSRFRGNDGTSERPRVANDATAHAVNALDNRESIRIQCALTGGQTRQESSEKLEGVQEALCRCLRLWPNVFGRE
jgi:hypothetical protein